MADPEVREFPTGARRDTEVGKNRFAASLSPWAIEELVSYMRRHNSQAHRREDNWKAGMPLDSFMESLFRHFHHAWKLHASGAVGGQEMKDALCGVLFNAQGYLHELVKPEPRQMLAEFRK